MGWRERLRAQQEATKKWIRDREAELKHSIGELESLDRQTYGQALREVVAHTSAELRKAVREAVNGRTPKASPKPQKSATSATRSAAPKPAAKTGPVKPANADVSPLRQFQAGLSGAADEFSFGLADRGLAAVEALRDGGLGGFGRRYGAEMGIKREEDAYDAEHFAAARNAGRVVGLAGGLAATGGVAGLTRTALAAAPRSAKFMAHVAKTPKLKTGVDRRGLQTLAAAGGGVSGVAGQGVADAISGRLSSPGDYLGAAAGGAVGGLAALKAGPMAAGLVGGGATSAGQDMANGRAVSVENAIEAAHLGAATAGLAGAAGTYGSAALSRKAKGELGEAMSRAKTYARGKQPGPKERVRLKKGGYTIPDQIVDGQLLEAKFGPGADLSSMQRKARRQFGRDFILDAWGFRDAGKAASAAGAPVGPQLTDEEQFPWRLR